jgi:23S rRNA pseudouridine2605 synthase
VKLAQNLGIQGRSPIRKKEFLNTEQLNTARLARWSQNGEARLTQEAAAEWLGSIGFCSYLPAASTAPSFLEAVVGRPAQTPSAGERSRTLELLARLIENSSAVPLKLGNALGEQPDFVASEESLRYIYALRGDRNFKNGPSTVGNEKVTTLAQHCWQAIEQHGPLTIAAMQPILGRDITEAAVARALQELWTGLYVFPILSGKGEAAQWELLSRRFPQQVAAGSSTGHAEAQSAMVSLYLHAAVAALEEDVLAFLSPLASQSKLREVVRGLGSMRQLDMIDVGGRSHVCLQGGLLPEMVAQLSEEQLTASTKSPEIEIEASPEEPKRFVLKKFVPRQFTPGQFTAGGSPAEARGPRRFAVRASADGRSTDERGSSRTSQARPGTRPGFGSGDRSGSGRPSRFAGQKPGGNYPPRPRTHDTDGPAIRKSVREDPDRPAKRGPGERARRWEKSGETAADRVPERRSFKPSGFKKSAGFKSPGGAKPWTSKKFNDRAGSPGEEGKKPWTSRPAGGSRFGSPQRKDRQSGESPKRWGTPGGEDVPGAGPRRPYGGKGKPSGYTASGFKSAGARSGASRGDSRPAGPRSFGAKPTGAKPWASKGAAARVGSARSYAARSGDGGKNNGKPAGAKPWSKRPSSDDGGGADRPKRPARTDASTGERSGAKPFWARNPRGGKGSTAAGRSNRPKSGGKAGKKPGKKK